MHLCAAARLLETSDEPVDITAQFDQTCEIELKQIQSAMGRCNVIFSYDKHHLFHKTNPNDVAQEIETVIQELDKLGYHLRILKGVLERERFSVKGDNGLCLQRLNDGLRIFFYTP